MIDRTVGPQMQERLNSAVRGADPTGASNNVRSAGETEEDRSFGETLMQAVSDVNDMERAADVATQDLATGASDDVAGAVMAAEKAQLAMGVTLNVREKALESYDNIMRMQL